MEEVIFQFLDKHYDPQSGILLALSGGSDSLALLHVLLKYCEKHPLKLALAHVDHNWRKESTQEAATLKEMSKALGLTFHLRILDPASLEGNLEAACREERLRFFEQVCIENDYQAVLLAHHADDQAETVLKRVLEGSSLPCLSGLRPIAVWENLALWRPMLSIRKKTIRQWLAHHQLAPFEDPTNEDPRFLRARLRTRILPGLAQDFGKEIVPALDAIGEEAGELREYLNAKVAPWLKKIEKGPFGILLDLQGSYPASPFELKYLLRKVCEEAGMGLSREQLHLAVQFVQAQTGNRRLLTGSHTVVFDRGCVFFLEKDLADPPSALPLGIGTQCYGAWMVHVDQQEGEEEHQVTNWRTLWKGKGEIILPEGHYQVGPPESQASYPEESPLNKWWSNAKIPAFFRMKVPVIWTGNEIRHEFLTGRRKTRRQEKGRWIKVTLEAIIPK